MMPSSGPTCSARRRGSKAGSARSCSNSAPEPGLPRPTVSTPSCANTQRSSCPTKSCDHSSCCPDARSGELQLPRGIALKVERELGDARQVLAGADQSNVFLEHDLDAQTFTQVLQEQLLDFGERRVRIARALDDVEFDRARFFLHDLEALDRVVVVLQHVRE